MAGLLYFVPKAVAVGPALDASGLGAVLGDSSLMTVQAFDFLGCGAGLVVVPKPIGVDGMAPECRYRAVEQEWRECDGGKYWVGWEIQRKPRPGDLIRKEQIDGHWVGLADEQEWLVPIARLFWGGTALPQQLILGPGGKVVQEAMPRFAALSADAAKVWAKFSYERLSQDDSGEKDAANDSDAPVLDVEEGWRIAVSCLALNYHVGPWEVSALRLLTSQNYTKVLQALIDIPTLVDVSMKMAAASKKNGSAFIPDGSSSGHGVGESLADTSQLTPTIYG
jgi:hypothetical protein